MKRTVLPALAGILLFLAFAPARAVEILRWERLPLAVPLVVNQERVVFIDRNVRVGVPPSVGESLRVQSAGGAIYRRATQPIPPTRLQLQDVDSGALILLDIAAEPAKAGQAALEPVRIVDGETAAVRYGEQAASVAKTDDEESPDNAASRARRRETPVAVVLTRYAAQNLYAPLRTVEPVAGIARVNLRRELALDTLLPTLPARAGRLAARRPVGDGGGPRQHHGPRAGTRPACPAGRLRGGHLPACEPGTGRAIDRHDGRLPRHSRARPGRFAVAQDQPHRRYREPARRRCGRCRRCTPRSARSRR